MCLTTTTVRPNSFWRKILAGEPKKTNCITPRRFIKHVILTFFLAVGERTEAIWKPHACVSYRGKAATRPLDLATVTTSVFIQLRRIERRRKRDWRGEKEREREDNKRQKEKVKPCVGTLSVGISKMNSIAARPYSLVLYTVVADGSDTSGKITVSAEACCTRSQNRDRRRSGISRFVIQYLL